MAAVVSSQYFMSLVMLEYSAAIAATSLFHFLYAWRHYFNYQRDSSKFCVFVCWCDPWYDWFWCGKYMFCNAIWFEMKRNTSYSWRKSRFYSDRPVRFRFISFLCSPSLFLTSVLYVQSFPHWFFSFKYTFKFFRVLPGCTHVFIIFEISTHSAQQQSKKRLFCIFFFLAKMTISLNRDFAQFIVPHPFIADELNI